LPHASAVCAAAGLKPTVSLWLGAAFTYRESTRGRHPFFEIVKLRRGSLKYGARAQWKTAKRQ
jgi:hypothetical protein